VNAVRSIGFDRRKGDDVLSLLAIRYRPEGEGPEGVVELGSLGRRHHRT